MSAAALGVDQAEVVWVHDGDYHAVASAMIAHASCRVLASVFIVDADTERDTDLKVESLLYEMGCAAWRGTDARLLVGGSHQNLDIARASFTALATARLHGLDARWLTRRAQRGSHAKLLITDDSVLTGSHNWSGGAMTGQTQDSLRVQSPALAAWLAAWFERQWALAGRGTRRS